MAKFTIDLLTINRYYATLEIEAPNLDAAKRIALDRAAAAAEDSDDAADFWGSPDERDLTAWQAGDDVIDGDDIYRMRIGDEAYLAAAT